MGSFVHLHTHSYYSLLDGCPSPAQMVQAAAHMGMPALALTDHNALYGAIEFYDVCHEAGIQPILGMELTVDWGDEHPGTLILLAQGSPAETGQAPEGYANLCRLSTALQTQPDREAALVRGLSHHLLEGHTTGLIALSGGKKGRLNHLIRTGDIRGAETHARDLAEVFGSDSLFVELQIQDPGDLQVTAELARLAQRLGLETVATNNVHYLAPDDATQCQLLAAMDTLQPLTHAPLREGLHLASPAETASMFSQFPGALANSREIAERCRLELPLGRPVFPEADLAEGQTPGSELHRQALNGAERRFGEVTGVVRDRLEREIALVDDLGYAPLFLIVADIVRYARQQEVPVNLRGSAAGSLVLYCLGVSTVDPLALDLTFERFLNPGRRDPPDIDLDLCSRRRDEVIRYVYQRYGKERVATICTYTRLRARSAWREVAKAYRLPQERIDAVARQIPRFWHPGMGGEVKDAQKKLLVNAHDDQEREALRAAWALDRHPRHLSVHPGGVVIAPGPLTDRVPLQLATKGVIITQYDLHGIERLGLVKIDLLGIRALTVVADSVEMVRRRQPSFSLGDIPSQDATTGELLSQARTIGCFQAESPGMRRTLRELRTRALEDVVVTLALYKPGPLRGGLKDAFVRRHRGEEPVHYLHPSLEPILRGTYGVVLYQEQVLRIVHELAGFSLGEADALRRAIGHLGRGQEMMPLREDFIQRAYQVSDVPPDVGAHIWELMASFAGYGFLKAHAASYAIVTYQTAYLKTHYPAEFMTAILRNWGGYYPQRVYLGEARRLGVRVRPPHINHSSRRFEMKAGREGRPVLWMGLGQVRHLTRKTTAAILAARKERAFESLGDLLHRVGPRRVEAENLIKSGALDGLGPSRKALLAEFDGKKPGQPLQLALPWDEAPDAGTSEDVTSSDEGAAVEDLAFEIETLGWPVSAHPLAPFAAVLAAQGAVRSDELARLPGQRVMVAGARMKLWGRRRGSLVLEDEGGLFTVRPPTRHRLPPGPLGGLGPYQVWGRVQVGRSEDVTLLAERITPL
jgi:DNA-directed DNA polymerase III PolC